eukprot:CAMPEP_0172177064 /NCGR_PEP_ID=MMETSP1050-20130122/15204_1 /TAXON_ID=233186 /ORGANISM="Cryptomonas curvata, Strain CCAP979/52" /LENGTH=114 /DNA_ID=CAMNT_0012849493 /DNA_START=33 /DNA_END=373 /DNA_ORIENTATION=-
MNKILLFKIFVILFLNHLTESALPTKVVDLANAHNGVIDVDLGSAMSPPGASTDGDNSQGVQTIELGGMLPSILSLLFGGGDDGGKGVQVITIEFQGPSDPSEGGFQLFSGRGG